MVNLITQAEKVDTVEAFFSGECNVDTLNRLGESVKYTGIRTKHND